MGCQPPVLQISSKFHIGNEMKDEFWNGVKQNNEKPRQQYFDLAQTNKVKQENPDLIN